MVTDDQGGSHSIGLLISFIPIYDRDVHGNERAAAVSITSRGPPFIVSFQIQPFLCSLESDLPSALDVVGDSASDLGRLDREVKPVKTNVY